MKDHPPVVEWWGARREAYEIDSSSPIVETLKSNIESLVGPCEMYGNSSASDAAYLAPKIGQYGGIPTVSYGPGGAGAHTFDEFVILDEVLKVTKVLAAQRYWTGATLRIAMANSGNFPIPPIITYGIFRRMSVIFTQTLIIFIESPPYSLQFRSGWLRKKGISRIVVVVVVIIVIIIAAAAAVIATSKSTTTSTIVTTSSSSSSRSSDINNFNGNIFFNFLYDKHIIADYLFLDVYIKLNIFDHIDFDQLNVNLQCKRYSCC